MNIHSERLRLDNGLLIVGVERPGADTTVLNVDVRVGSRFEGPKEHGLSHALEHMIFQGCDSVPEPDAVNIRAERMGAAFEAWTSRDQSRFSHWLDPHCLEESAALLGDLLRRPVFAKLESERAIILEESLDEVDEDGRVVDADSLAYRALWPKHPLGQNVIGPRANIERFSHPDLRRHHARYFGGRNMVVTVVGPDAPTRAIERVAPALAKLPPGAPAECTPPKALTSPEVIFVDDGRSQVEVRLLFATPGRRHPHAPALRGLRRILDDGLGSRMHRRLGGELGLAYSQWAAWEANYDAGAFELGAAVSPAKVVKFVEAAAGLLTDLRADPPQAEEMDHLRFRTRWSWRCAHENPEAIAGLYGTPHLFQPDPPAPMARLTRRLEVEAETLRSVAQTYFRPDSMVACFVGPLSKADRRALRRAPRLMRG